MEHYLKSYLIDYSWRMERSEWKEWMSKAEEMELVKLMEWTSAAVEGRQPITHSNSSIQRQPVIQFTSFIEFLLLNAEAAAEIFQNKAWLLQIKN